MIAAAMAACTGPPSQPIAGATAPAQQEEAREIIQELDGREENRLETDAGTGLEMPGNETPSLEISSLEIPSLETPSLGVSNQGTHELGGPTWENNRTGPSMGWEMGWEMGWPAPETITVPGAGSAEAEPDHIRLSLGAVSQGDEPLTILEEVTLAIMAMTREAEKLGIDSADIRTSTFQVNEQYRYDPTTGEQRRTGFKAIQRSTVTIRDTELAGVITGRLIGAVADAGAAELSLQGVSAGLDDPEALRIQALEQATMNLWEQARTVAAQSGRQVCRMLEVQAGGAGQHHGQGGISFEPPVIRAASAGMMEGSARSIHGGASISPGTVRETAWVTGVFLMAPTGEEPGAGCGGA